LERESMPRCIHGFLPIIKRIECVPRPARAEVAGAEGIFLVNQASLRRRERAPPAGLPGKRARG
jgi:hypothetical protein